MTGSGLDSSLRSVGGALRRTAEAISRSKVYRWLYLGLLQVASAQSLLNLRNDGLVMANNNSIPS